MQEIKENAVNGIKHDSDYRIAGGVIPVSAMAEEMELTEDSGIQSNENEPLTGEEVSTGEEASGGEEVSAGEEASGGEEVPGGEEVSAGEEVPAGGGETVSENDVVSNEEEAEEESQDTDMEYCRINFYSDDVLLETREVKAGEKLSELPEPVKEGYIFAGWATAEEDGEMFDQEAAITRTMDLYAKWEIIVEVMSLENDVMPVSAQEVSYSIDGGSTWVEGSLGEAFDACQSASQPAEIRLLQDITLTGSNWGTPKSLAGSSDVTIDGQKHTITRGEGAGGTSGNLFELNQAHTVTLKDITIDGGAVWQGNDPESRTNTGLSIENHGSLIRVYNGGTLILEAGTVLRNNELVGTSHYGGAVSVGGNSASIQQSFLIMKSGAEIANNAASAGGGVFVYKGSDFQMEGGKIYGNCAKFGVGGGVLIGGSFTMAMGEISGNAAYQGGGLGIGGAIYTEDGSVRMLGGSISNNVASYGGGVQIADGNFLMSGGNISGNNAKGTGGGVDIRGAGTQMEMSGGSITGNTADGNGGGVFVFETGEIKASANPVITGNTKKEEANNAFLWDGKLITITGAMTQGASIGVKYGNNNEVIFTSRWASQMGGAEKPQDYFSSDRSDFIVVRDEVTNEAKLVSHIHNYGTEWKWDDGTHWHECDCGAKTDQAAHTEDAGTITREPTETETGEKVYRCSVCGHERTEILQATGGGSGDDQGGTGDNQGGSGDNQGGTGDNQGGNGDDQGGSGDNQGGSGDDQGGTGDNQGGTGDNQGGTGDDQGSNDNNQSGSVEDQGSSDAGADNDDAAIQSTESAGTTETAEIKVISESTLAVNQADEENVSQKEASSGSTEPKTGENTAVEVYATIAMIAGLMYLLSYFDFDRRGMTEAEKRELLTRIIQWSKKGGHIRTGLALAAIFLLLMYYHSIGKKAAAGWKEVYGE